MTYALAIYHLNLFLAFLTPRIDPAMADLDDDGEYFIFLSTRIAGLGSRSRSEPCVFGSLEPEPLEEKKPGAGAAWKKSPEPEPLKK